MRQQIQAACTAFLLGAADQGARPFLRHTIFDPGPGSRRTTAKSHFLSRTGLNQIP